ncbi:hypothetical protein VITFI_CDS0001 [Vitreoscilla filiformis]|uniref:Uncharacterized protein n=2 Tax=Vitreoscilla filiformis TaxID=63 RepID=A0A221KAB8_VITFI|nr:hypothetical protein VITFI_CDS0001 [Vitreoscilla filiformis]
MCAKPLGEIPLGAAQLAFISLEMSNRVPRADQRLELSLSTLLCLALSHRAVEVFGKEQVHCLDVMAGITVFANRLAETALEGMATTLRLFDDGAGSGGDSFLEAMRGMQPPSAPPSTTPTLD